MNLWDLLRTVFVRRLGTFVVVLLVSVATAAAVIAVLPERYEGSASLFVGEDRPIDAAGAAQRDDVLARSFVELLGAPAVADRVLTGLDGGLTREQLLSRMSFELKAGTQLIEVAATDASPGVAADIANAYAETFVVSRREIDRETRRQRLSALASDIQDAGDRYERIRDTGGPGAESETGEALNRLVSLRGAYKSLESSMVLEGANVTVASAAVASNDPVAPRPVLYGMAAIVLACFLAVAAALARDHFDQRLRSEVDVATLTGVPVLARIPRLKPGVAGADEDAFAFLRANLRMREAPRTILVVSPSTADGKTTTVMGLARSFASTGQTTIAADFDFRARGLSATLDAADRIGLTDFAAGDAGLPDCLVPAGDELRVAVAGAPRGDRFSWFNHRTATRLSAALAEEADVVVFDSGPVNLAVETSILVSTGIDAVVIVVDLKKTKRSALLATVKQLEQSGAVLRGVVVNRVKGGASGYGYGYGAEQRGATSSTGSRAVPAGSTAAR